HRSVALLRAVADIQLGHVAKGTGRRVEPVRGGELLRAAARVRTDRGSPDAPGGPALGAARAGRADRARGCRLDRAALDTRGLADRTAGGPRPGPDGGPSGLSRLVRDRH